VSTYRHVLAPISRCEYRGSISLDSLPPEVRGELLRRGEALLTELDEDLAKALGIENLSNYQYVRFLATASLG
jgi:hypothetical protein